jgi:hypothetical protein
MRGLLNLRRRSFARLAVVLAAAFSLTAVAPAVVQAAEPSGGLSAFRSDAELRRFIKALDDSGAVPYPPPPAAPPPPTMATPMPGAAAPAASAPSEVVVTGSRAESITNTQEANVDEGGIVKAQGDILVILRRGRLFTVSIAGGGLSPVDHIDAFPPGGGDGWYDEMLLIDGRVVVIGYSYRAGGTEVNRFTLSKDGKLAFEDSYHLRSADYYSSENYATRLIGTKLILYAPLPLWGWDEDPLEILPGMRKWTGRGEQAKFRRTAKATRIFVAPDLRRDPDDQIDTLHAVTTCDLAAANLDCASMGVLGPESRSFYVSSNAVYLWVGDAWADDRRRGGSPSQIYRIPLREGRPSAVGVRGGPIDQFSFREDAREGVLNVVVRSEGGGDAMWQSEFSEGALALVRIPIRRFGDGSRDVAASRYRWLPFSSEGGRVTNRFVGDYLLYGEGGGWFRADRDDLGGRLWAAPLEGGAITALRSPQAVDRIEITGRDALVIGPGRQGDLLFQTVELTLGAAPVLGDRYSYKDASEGETRSHAFFYSPAPGAAYGDSGLLALPVARAARPAYRQLFESSAAMVYLRRSDRRLSPLGELAAGTEGFVDDGCKASCTDWYGNARPIFLGGRAFALLGYELVEGQVAGNSIRETGRINFAPAARPAER